MQMHLSTGREVIPKPVFAYRILEPSKTLLVKFDLYKIMCT